MKEKSLSVAWHEKSSGVTRKKIEEKSPSNRKPKGQAGLNGWAGTAKSSPGTPVSVEPFVCPGEWRDRQAAAWREGVWQPESVAGTSSLAGIPWLLIQPRLAGRKPSVPSLAWRR